MMGCCLSRIRCDPNIDGFGILFSWNNGKFTVELVIFFDEYVSR